MPKFCKIANRYGRSPVNLLRIFRTRFPSNTSGWLLLKIVEKHVPLKMKTLRGNYAPFASKELRKAIYTRSRFRNSLTVNYASSCETNVSLLEKNQSNIFF